MCLRRAPEKYIAGAALDRAVLDNRLTDGDETVSLTRQPAGRSLPPGRFIVALTFTFYLLSSCINRVQRVTCS
jgi:hypothetical protein